MSKPIEQPGQYFWIMTVQTAANKSVTLSARYTPAPEQTRQSVFSDLHKFVASELGIDLPVVLFFFLEPNQLP